MDKSVCRDFALLAFREGEAAAGQPRSVRLRLRDLEEAGEIEYVGEAWRLTEKGRESISVLRMVPR